MRAIIDIGTNSVRLLMAEKDEKGEWKILRKELRSTRLGEGMTDKATIGQGAKERTLSAVGEFTAMAKLEGAKDIFAYGTSIMRDASNGEEFADEVTAAFGVPVRILSGKEEAYYSYIGAAGTSGVRTAILSSISAAARQKSAWDSAPMSERATASASGACAARSSSIPPRPEAAAS